MSALCYTVTLEDSQSVQVHCSADAKICVVDDENLGKFRARQRFRYFGRRKARRDVVIRPSRAGRWHVMVFGRDSGLKADVAVI